MGNYQTGWFISCLKSDSGPALLCKAAVEAPPSQFPSTECPYQRPSGAGSDGKGPVPLLTGQKGGETSCFIALAGPGRR